MRRLFAFFCLCAATEFSIISGGFLFGAWNPRSPEFGDWPTMVQWWADTPEVIHVGLGAGVLAVVTFIGYVRLAE